MDYAQACLHEQNGRSHRAAGRTSDFIMCYDQAIILFLKLGLSSEASDCYEGLGQLDKAAGLLPSPNKSSQVAKTQCANVSERNLEGSWSVPKGCVFL